jgi:hypothetical protein
MHCAVLSIGKAVGIHCGLLLQWLGIAVELALNNNRLCSKDIYLSVSNLKSLNYANIGRCV